MEIRAFAIEAVEHIQPSRVPGTVMVGGVCVRGLDELQPSAWPGNLSFVDRWRDAMCLCIGTEEFEKYCSQSKKPWR